MLLELLAFLIVGIAFFYHWATKNNDFFEKRNIPYAKPSFFFGTVKDITLNRKSRFDAMCEFYNHHSGPVYGSFENRDPILVIRDPLLVKRILIKDFDHFVNRRGVFAEGSDNMFGNSLFLMENDKWRDMRNTLSPAFTGSKLRQMFQFMLDSTNEAMSYLREQQQVQECGQEIDIKDFTTRLTNDIIASTAFGLKINSFRDKDNEFYTKAMYIMSFPFGIQMKIMFTMMFPRLANLLNIRIFGKYADYFSSLVLDAMKYRKDNNIQRPDIIHLLMEARGMIDSESPKMHSREWSDLDLVAQCFAFFFAALETSSLVMSFAAHELMENPKVQQKLHEEIKTFENQLEENQSLSPEILQKMPYLDMVVSEVLRKWPVNIFTDRMCTKDFTFESTEEGGERIEIRKGDAVRIIMSGLHRDPKYYENPSAFDPKRFSEENKKNIDAGTYLPFGLGPRSCIGLRFALLEVKTFLYYLIRDYRLEASPRTTLPMEISTSNLHFEPKGGFWLKFVPRK